MIVVRDGVVGAEGDDYVWEHDDVPLPPNDLLIIYELHVGDFTGGEGDDGAGRYTDVIAKLPYLADLGITAIELMPVQETAGDYWGYLPKYFYASETAYGNPERAEGVDRCLPRARHPRHPRQGDESRRVGVPAGAHRP